MFKAIEFKDTRNFKTPIYIDLRSEKEYYESHILNSINLPILNTEEREIVGTLYVNGNIELAKKKGIDFGSSKLPKYYETIYELTQKGQVVLYCARGGYRSTVLFNLLKSLGEPVYKINFGYKGYRNYIINEMSKLVSNITFINLNGYTGTGKTEILHFLKNKGENILDLESIASHRGSNLGHIGLKNQPSQKMFESLLFDELYKLQNKRVFVESESTKIGNLLIPKYLYNAYANSPNQILITSTLENRVERIKNEYLKGDKKILDKQILKGLESLSKYINKDRFLKYKNLIEKSQYDEIIQDMIEKYYDQNYSIRKSNFLLTLENLDSNITSNKLIEFFNFLNK